MMLNVGREALGMGGRADIEFVRRVKNSVVASIGQAAEG